MSKLKGVKKDGHVSSLCVEITRKCNFTCGHCLRGEAQNVNLDINLLRKFLHENKIQSISELTITGGEPLLVPDLIDQMIQEMRWLRIEVQNFHMTTNGSKFTPDTLNTIGKLFNFCTDNSVSGVDVSNSIWHSADKNYVPFFSGEDLQYEILDHKDFEEYGHGHMGQVDFERINKRTKLTSSSKIIREGRAKDWGTNQIEEISEIDEDDEDNSRYLIYLNANGEVIEDYCDASFETQEQIKTGGDDG